MGMTFDNYFKKLRGCYIGKAVGGTLGMPREGLLDTASLTYYDPVPDKMVGNDDLDLQVVWLEAVRKSGLPVNRRALADAWTNHIVCNPDEYGVCRKNLRQGLFPPSTGFYDNKFGGGMGAAIRTEIWAGFCPGDPALAVKLAREDACCDHYGDGLEASVFLTAVESAAYLESDAHRLIETGLSFISAEGRLARALRDTMAWCEETDDPFTVREQILQKYYVQNWTDVSINLSFILTAWLLGRGDFSKSLCDVVNLGYDADCTGATLGAILGLIDPDSIDEKWTAPIGDDLILSTCILGMHEAPTILDFCRQLAQTGADIRRYYGSATTVDGWPEALAAAVPPMDLVAASDRYITLGENHNLSDSLIAVAPLTLTLRYPPEVALAPSTPTGFTLLVSHPGGQAVEGTLELAVPYGFSVEPATLDLRVEAGGQAALSFTVTAPPREVRRKTLNQLVMTFRLGTFEFSCDAGLITTFPWLRAQAHHAGSDCPPAGLFAKAEVVDAPFSFQPVPAGGQLYAIEVKAHLKTRAVVLAQGTRPIKLWVDDDLILDHDGSEYTPAYHRSENTRVATLDGDWRRVTIQAGDGDTPGELFFGLAREFSCEWLTEFEYRPLQLP